LLKKFAQSRNLLTEFACSIEKLLTMKNLAGSDGLTRWLNVSHHANRSTAGAPLNGLSQNRWNVLGRTFLGNVKRMMFQCDARITKSGWRDYYSSSWEGNGWVYLLVMMIQRSMKLSHHAACTSVICVSIAS
jgi:hypothetical protein